MNITRRNLLAGSVATALSGGPAVARTARRPRGRDQIVLLMVDDLFDVVYNLNRFGVRVRAPNVLRLISEGVYFSNAYCSTPLCCPSRAAIISGRNPIKTGVHNNTTPWFDKFDIHSTLPGLMAASGYRSFMFGKITHGGPNLAGPGNIWHDSGICEISTTPNPLTGETEDRAIARVATDCIHSTLRTSTDRWLLMVGLKGPHAPLGDRPELLDRLPLGRIRTLDWDGDPKSPCFFGNGGFANLTEDQIKRKVQGYLADVWAMDTELGRILASLRTAGLDPTIIFAGDHGFSLGDHDEIGKSTLWDDVARTPLVIKYPGCPAGMVVPQAVSLLDIAPTLLNHVGIARPSYLDGESLLPIINRGAIRTSGAMTTMNDNLSFRDNGHRITRYAPCAAFSGFTYELYDQVSDPESAVNLFGRPGYEVLEAEMLAKFDSKLAEWSN